MSWHNTRTVTNGLHGFPNHTYNMAQKCFPWDSVQTYYITIVENSLKKMTWQPQRCTQNYSTLLCPDRSLLHPLRNSAAMRLCSLSLQQFSSLWIDSKGQGNQNNSPIPIQLPQRPTSTPSSQLAHLVLHPEMVLHEGQQGMCHPCFQSPIFLGLELHVNLKIAGTWAETQQSPPEMQLAWIPKRHIHAGIQAARSPDPHLATAVCTVLCSECYIMK